MKHYALSLALVGCALMTAACSGTGLNPAGIGPSSTVRPPTVSLAVGDTAVSTLAEGVNSCPDGSAPGHFVVSLNKDNGADFSWDGTVNVDHYSVTMEREDATNTFVLAGAFVEATTHHALLLDSEGRYRARIRTRSCRTHNGPWSEWLAFSTELPEGSFGLAPPPFFPGD